MHVIQPVEGARLGTRWYRLIYAAAVPVMPLLLRLFPERIVTTAELGRAMLAAARFERERAVLETADIARLGRMGVG